MLRKLITPYYSAFPQKIKQAPFYSRKFKKFFTDWNTFQKYAKYDFRKRLVEKIAYDKKSGKAYLPEKYRKYPKGYI